MRAAALAISCPFVCAHCSANDRRSDWPRFKEGAFEANLEMVERVKELAAKKGVTPGQLALAWVHVQGPDVFPIPGTKRVKYLEVCHTLTLRC
jgi:aryl-alcohol dehydrogenase-like predicted oxidoreductase